MKLVGHVFRDKSSPTHQTVNWLPTYDYTSEGDLKPPHCLRIIDEKSRSSVHSLDVILEVRNKQQIQIL